MKNIYALMALGFFVGSVCAQSQRLTIVEGFTQASCGPCAPQNPVLHQLVKNNPGKIISLKYQVSWPGTDPMNAQNPTQPETRRNYYNVTGVPFITYDGNTNIGGTFPGDLSQAEIDAQYNTPSSFDFDLSHTVSADYDSVFITAAITATENINISTGTNPLRLHILLVEKEINFDSPPGTNGERNFYNVMRVMLPNDLGTALPSVWATGDDTVITIKALIPSYIYSLNQVAIIGFIQNNNNKNIMQAAATPALPVANDAGVSAISNIPLLQCDTTITPSVTIKNYGSDTLTSAVINYRLNNGTVLTQNWTGSLALDETVLATLPPMTVSQGSNTFNSFITMPNGVEDLVTTNNAKSTVFNISLLGIESPIQQSFQPATFPPANYYINNPDKGATWERATGAGGLGNSTASARMFFNASPAGEIDELFLPALDFTNTSVPIMFDFNVACAQLSNVAFGQLEVFVSTDCGTSWTSAYDKAGSALSTAPNNNQTLFVPTASQWRTESLDLSSYVDQSHVLIKFKATSNGGNTLYLDDVHVRSTTDIKENSANFKLNIFPNPANSTVNIHYSMENSKNANIKMVDAIGKVVYLENVESAGAGSQTSIINVATFSPGIYFVQFTSGNVTEIKKVSIIK